MFAIYKRLEGGQKYKFVRPVDGLGGQAGPFAKRIRSATAANEIVNQTLRWHLDERDLLTHYLTDSDKADVPSLKLIIDLKPKSEDELQFFEILEVWGCSDPGWSPLMLKLCFLFEAEGAQEVRDIRESGAFVSDTHTCSEERVVYEFLYLKFGWARGEWGWGTVGSVNGTLLFPQHLEFFARHLVPRNPEV